MYKITVIDENGQVVHNLETEQYTLFSASTDEDGDECMNTISSCGLGFAISINIEGMPNLLKNCLDQLNRRSKN